MDRIEAKDYLQAAALGCLDDIELNELKELLEFDSELQFELASYQTLCALIPFSLEIINPGDVIKDNVALRLKRIEEEARAKREVEMKSQHVETKIENTSEIDEELKPTETTIDDLTEEMSQESVIESPAEEVELQSPEIFEAPIPESYLADDLTKTEDIPDIPVEEEIISEELFDVEIEDPPTEELRNEITQGEENILPNQEIAEESGSLTDESEIEEQFPNERKRITESFEGQVKIDRSYSDSKLTDITSRTVAERLQKSFQLDIEAIKNSVEKSESKLIRGIIALIIICAVLLAVCIFIFFKFTADIKNLELEIEKVKRSNSVGSLYQNPGSMQNFDKNSFIHPSS